LEPVRLTIAARYLAFASALFLIVGHAKFWRNGTDFASFWTAASFVLQGRAATAYDPIAVAAAQHAAGFPAVWPFISPPPLLVLVAPFGALPYPLALQAWIVAGYAAYALSIRWLPRAAYWPALAFPGGVLCAMAGQNGLLTTALICAAMGALPRRKVLAGVFVGLLVIKPQLALLTPVALAAGREWRAFGAAAATAIGALALSVVVLGWGPMAAFLGSSGFLGGLYARPELLPKIKSVFAVAVQIGAPSSLALALQGAVAAFAGWAVWRVWRRTRDPLARAAVLAAATPLAPPYVLLYDPVFLVLPVIWLGVESARRGFRTGERALLALGYMMPVLALAAPAAAPVVPVWSLALLLAVLLRQPKVSLPDGA
jgi:hypothetical protein